MHAGEIMQKRIKQKWGFLRETEDLAKGIDKATGLHRTGLEKYLAVIFPDVSDWIHDEPLIGKYRPDYYSPSLKLIIEFDGLPHYKYPATIKEDMEGTAEYLKAGYKVVRIPYFIQLSRKVVKQLFDVDVQEELFDDAIPSMAAEGPHTPAAICGAGILRMAKEFKNFREQYEVNLNALKRMNDESLSGASILETLYNSLPD